jgi:predicted nucleic acid-binding protein
LLADSGITGGALCDALIGLTAREAGVELISCDPRAAVTCEAVGVRTWPLQ